MKPPPSPQPFWKDDAYSDRTLNYGPGFSKAIIAMPLIIHIWFFGFMLFVIYQYMSPALAWMILIVMGVAICSGIVRRRRNRSLKDQTTAIQAQARNQTGAIEIGSAVHVAGHPLLEREQPIVLALIEGKGLCLYSYDNNDPLDTIPVEGLVSIHTVVYDDERVPHIDAVDSTAQALQIAFMREGKEFTMLFRRMKKPRPIDWYHALQKSRLSQHH
jgi:hypothetical protein